MIAAILWGLARHVLTSLGGALFAYGVQKLCPSCIGVGGAMSVIGAGLSVGSKLKASVEAQNHKGFDDSTINDKR